MQRAECPEYDQRSGLYTCWQAAQREGISTSPGLYYYKVQISLQGCLNRSRYDEVLNLRMLLACAVSSRNHGGGRCGIFWCRVVMMPYEGLGL